MTTTRHRKTHYEVLGIERSCSTKEVKSAFLRLSKELHPDRNPGDVDAHEKFVVVNEAYSVLSNAENRVVYDQMLKLQYRQRYDIGMDSNRNPNQSYWRDDSIWEMRNRNEDEHFKNGAYYGIKGVKRLPNWCVVAVCAAVLSIGAFGHYMAVKYGGALAENRLNKRDMLLSKMYQQTRQKAVGSSNEEQLLALKRAIEEQESPNGRNREM